MQAMHNKSVGYVGLSIGNMRQQQQHKYEMRLPKQMQFICSKRLWHSPFSHLTCFALITLSRAPAAAVARWR